MKQYSFNSIAFIIWILTIHCKVSNGRRQWSDDRYYVLGRFEKIYEDIDELKRLDKEKSNEIQSLKLEKDNEIQSLKLEKDNEIQSLKLEKDNEIQSLKSEKDNEIKLLQSEIIKLKLRTAPKSCAQLSFAGLMNDDKKEWINPDGRSTGNVPIEVSILRHFLKIHTVSLHQWNRRRGGWQDLGRLINPIPFGGTN